MSSVRSRALGLLIIGAVLYWAAVALAMHVLEPEFSPIRAPMSAYVLAVIRYRARLENVVGGQENPLGHFWHMDAYEKRDGRWQVVWSQATQIQSREAEAK